VDGLCTQFGLAPLLDKSLAVVSDARFRGERMGALVERLLCISGEDRVTVDRKFLPAVTVKLPTRFMFLSNELPRLPEMSGALAGRFLVLRLTRSFYGREDRHLRRKLEAELPGILKWALEGWARLRDQDRFTEPASAAELQEELAELFSPVETFVRECCEVGPTLQITVDDLYNAYVQWCRREGREHPVTRRTFGRDLRTVVPEITRRRLRHGGPRFYCGITLTVSVAQELLRRLPRPDGGETPY